jgi:hypothetical protein
MRMRRGWLHLYLKFWWRLRNINGSRTSKEKYKGYQQNTND